MLCHDMDFAIPWIPLNINEFHWLHRSNFFGGRYRVREMPRLSMFFASNTRSAFTFILADLCSGTAHILHYNTFPKLNLCGNITKSIMSVNVH